MEDQISDGLSLNNLRGESQIFVQSLLCCFRPTLKLVQLTNIVVVSRYTKNLRYVLPKSVLPNPNLYIYQLKFLDLTCLLNAFLSAYTTISQNQIMLVAF